MRKGRRVLEANRGDLQFELEVKGAARQDLVDDCERAVACLQASP